MPVATDEAVAILQHALREAEAEANSLHAQLTLRTSELHALREICTQNVECRRAWWGWKYGPDGKPLVP
jgi:hypothetical protein